MRQSRSELLENWNAVSIDETKINTPGNLNSLTYQEAKRKFEKTLITKMLKENNSKVSATAQILGLDRSWLYRKIKDLKIDLPT